MTDERQATLREGFRVLWRALRDEPVILGVAVAGSALYGIMTVASSVVIGRVTDDVVVPAFREGDTTTGALVAAALAIFVTALLKAAGIVVRRYYAGLGQYRLNARYRRRVTRQYLRLPLSWHHRHSTGTLLSNANADVEATFFPIAPLPFALGVVVMLVFALVSMFLADPLLALVGALVFPAILLLNFVYQRRLSPLATRAQALRAELSGVAHESFDGAAVVKAMGREADETHRFAGVAHQLRDANIGVGRIRGAFDPVLEALPNLGVLVVLAVGSVRVADGTLEAGTLVQVAYLLTVTAFPIRAIGFVLGELPRSVVGWRRVSAVLDATGSLPYGSTRLTGSAQPARLGLNGLSYSYVDGAPVLNDVTLDVAPGRTVAVVGATGSGKSTLASLLVRLVDPVSGAVLLDGTDLREFDRGEVAEAVSLVFQQPFVFEDTVRDNVTLGRDAPDESVWAALRLAQGDGFVAELADDLDAPIGERGATLSGGQRQRLALARAVVREPRLLVLDDATSAVDPEVERRILAGLRDASLPSTVVVVAYRRATIALADEVVYVDGGRISARGTHDELLRTSAGYRELITAYERDAAERATAATDSTGGQA
ncbi:ABC-type multidrug transport system fused ATPase/permease subunit [Haloactinopolyspora alba]|uniref:ABC-type multidrug transport system fused ATPase/permease subunit n=1 Tax=Haloactinopolyspora alba TaxID=648780 RepID=A0A2P8E407_9ACTN|nr:ABC transporter ATP-binding protein [Haloactinopolyspora alba]PSL04190.1 ABC-type multidrug transport system fused ATPase/permease subunit [Haloactinopolyspora alba]